MALGDKESTVKVVSDNQTLNRKEVFNKFNDIQKRFGPEFKTEKDVEAKFGKKVKKICPGNAYNSSKSTKGNQIVCDHKTDYYENAKISCVKCNKLLMNEEEFKDYAKAVKRANDPDRKK